MNHLDKEEEELLESLENDEWVSIDNVEQEIKRFQSYARNQLAYEYQHSKKSNRNDLISYSNLELAWKITKKRMLHSYGMI